MKGQEVMELMNRYLDGELNELELERLERHLRQSPEAAAMFERLKRLHHQLEQLPMVTPPTSIVDAILPRLQQIDAGEGDAARERDGSGNRMERRMRPNRKWAVGTVAAAVLALAVALPTGIGLLERNASDMADAPSGAALRESSRSADSAGALAFGTAQSTSAFGETDGADSDESVSDNGTPIANLSPEKAQEKAPVQFSAKEQYGRVDASGEAFSDGGPTDGQPVGEPGDGELPRLEGTEHGLMGLLGFTEVEATEDGRTPVMEYAEGVPPAGWQVSVVRNGDGAHVIITDEEGVDAFVTSSYPGEPYNFRWSEDGNRMAFDYETEGTAYRVTIDLVEGTEQAEIVTP